MCPDHSAVLYSKTIKKILLSSLLTLMNIIDIIKV